MSIRTKARSHLVSIGKALTWRVVALACTAGTTYVLTGSLQTAVTIGLVDSAVKLGLYYMHERAWTGGMA